LVSLSDRGEGKLLDEVAIGESPSAVALLPDGKHVLASAARSTEVTLLIVEDNHLKSVAKISVGYEPRGIAVSADGKTAYVALTVEDKIAVVDLAARKKVADIAVGRWPRFLCLSPGGEKLAVGCSGSGGVWMIDTPSRTVAFKQTFEGLNLAHMMPSPDGREVWFPWTFYGQRETTPGSIRQGWVMASRLGAVPFDESARPRGFSLDPRRNAVADGHGAALSADGKRLVMTSAGTQELLVFAVDKLPWIGIGGSEHMDRDLASDKSRFTRFTIGGRPLAVRLAKNGERAYVANYLRNSIQTVDLAEHKVVAETPLGGAAQPAAAERRGAALFYDARRSLENWYSCHTCHYEGGPNSETIDTFNDGSVATYKTIPPLHHVAETGPYTWHGWQKDLADAILTSYTVTMRGPKPTDAEVSDVAAFLATLKPGPNAHRVEGRDTAAIERGRALFHSSKAGCATCHTGSLATDGEIHDVGLSRPSDKYQGYNTPSLVDVQRRALLMHDGRARTLEDLLTGPHAPGKLAGEGDLSEAERRDLIEYLRTL
jgi:DNA-binding beta-propeller fold protein YncE